MLKEQLRRNKYLSRDSQSGQSLIEILVGVTIATIIIGGAAATIALTLRSSSQNKNIQTATSLSQELLDELSSFTDANWHNIYGLPKNPGTPPKSGPHRLTETSGVLSSVSGSETLPAVDGTVFTRHFTVENVSRDSGDNVMAASYDPSLEDPSTQRVLVTTTWSEAGDVADVTLNKILTRKKNLIIHQDSWDSGATAPADPSAIPDPVTSKVPNQYFDASNIDASGGVIKVQGF